MVNTNRYIVKRRHTPSAYSTTGIFLLHDVVLLSTGRETLLHPSSSAAPTPTLIVPNTPYTRVYTDRILLHTYTQMLQQSTGLYD